MAQSIWVLIAAAGKPELLARTLRSLAACHKPANYRGAVIVENGPRCGIAETVRSFPKDERLHLCYVPDANKSHALNCGLMRLDGCLVMMTDDDVRLGEHSLVAYDEAARGIDRGEFYGGPVLIDAEHGLPPLWLRKFYPPSIAEAWRLQLSKRTAIADQTFLGTNWAAFADDLHAIGGFDTRLGPGTSTFAAGQETEAQRRLLSCGSRAVYVPDAIAWHYLHAEFLDPAWVRRRAVRHGLEWGIRRARGHERSLTPFIRAGLGLFNAHVKGALLRMIGGEAGRFEAAYHVERWRGRWNGLWLGRKWDQLPQLVAHPPLPMRQAA